MTSPQIMALNTVSKTAAAATSLIISITGLISLQLISASFSTAVLKSSAAKTEQILITSNTQCIDDNFKIRPIINTKTAKNISILKFLSFAKA